GGFFSHFLHGRFVSSLTFRVFGSAAELPHDTLRTKPLPAPDPGKSTKPKSRFSHLPRIFARAAILLVPAALLFTFLTVKLLHHSGTETARLPAYSQGANSQDQLDPASQPRRPIFPYSIVPGGVRDARELQSAASHDPVVAQHYADFHIATARTVRLEKPLEMYVSYRRNDKVYWTKNRMLIPAGETLLSDGESLARVRCGNRLSAIAAKPVSLSDPTQEELNAPEFVPPLMAELLPGEGGEFFPGTPGGAIPALPIGTNPGSKTPGPGVFPPPLLPPGLPPVIIPNPPVPPPVSTPEPGTFTFLFAGAAFVILFGSFALRRNGSS
ncbi:MAG TPA: hypothetical protein VM781_02345, partial [Candidatus Bathyarchaeia archaeon]|nr:hypothetical protein [Candidatus Bathyarchaeia archaeon]